MMTWVGSGLLIAGLTVSGLRSAGAQAPTAAPRAVLENASARLEVIGLRRWTLAMIQDSLARYAPEDSLLSHACAAVLRGKLGFADASATYYPPGYEGRTKGFWVVSVVEPQDSSLVRYRPAYRDTLPPIAEWAAIRAAFEAHNQAFQSVVQWPAFMHSDAELRASDHGLSDSALRAVMPMRDALRRERSPAATRRALDALMRDGRHENRLAAVLVLGGAAARGDDRAWRALAEALRDPSAMVSGTAEQVLGGLLERGGESAVDWGPSAPTLRALLDGTNLFAHNRILETLASTRVTPALAVPLLRGGGHLVLAKLTAEGMRERMAARRFLVQIAGRDLGEDPHAWGRWVASLART